VTLDTETMARLLRQADLLRIPGIQSAIDALRLPKGSRGLDAGCGIGSLTTHLADAIGTDGHVTGVDSSAALLRIADHSAIGSTDRVSFQRTDVMNLPFDAMSFDWAWSVDCVGFIPGDPVTQIGELVRVVRPGGTIALLLWSSQQLLPGHPILEARLNATTLGLAPFTAGDDPETHHLRALRWLTEAGLADPSARTFVCTAHAPLDEEHRDALAAMIGMRWGDHPAELNDDDLAEYRRITDRKSPDSIVDHPGYYGFFTYSMFSGTVAG